MKDIQVRKIIPTLTFGLNFGVGQVQVGLGVELETVGRVGEIDFASKVGPSPLSLGSILGVVEKLHGLDLQEKMHMDAVLLAKVGKQLEDVSFQVGVIERVDQLKVVEAKFGSAADSEDAKCAIIPSLFLCITHAIGEESAVRCIKEFLLKLSSESNSGSPTIHGAWLETYLEKLRKSVSLARLPKFERMVDDYNIAFHQGLAWNERYVKPVEKVVGKMLDTLALPSDNSDASTPSVWWTRSRKVHKLAYLLCLMGWNVSVEPHSEALPKPHKTNLIVKFTSDRVVEGDLIEAKLYPAGVGPPTRISPSVEDEQGPGVLLPNDGLMYATRAVLEGKDVEGRAIEDAWRFGYAIGETCKVELVFGEAECGYRFGEYTLKEEPGRCWSAVEDIMHEIDRPLKKYGAQLGRVLGGYPPDYHNLSGQLTNILKNKIARLSTSTDDHENVGEGKLRLVVAFYLGLVYGKLEALLVATGLKDANGAWAEGSTPLEFRVGWMDFMGQFLYDVHAKMWDLSMTNSAPPRMHSVFSFIGMCCSSKSIYFGKQVQLEDIVGFWTGTSLIMLAAAMNPGINPESGAKLESYPVWMLNLSTVDGVHLQSSKWIGGEKRIRDLGTDGAPDTLPPFEIPARKLDIHLSPNYVEENAKLVHSMMCEGDIVYVAPVMGALVNLHRKTIRCTCDGTNERRRSCRGGLYIYTGEFIMGNRSVCGSSGDEAEMPEEVGLIMARDDIPWRFAASCIYHDKHFVIAGPCLSCAREGKVNEKWG